MSVFRIGIDYTPAFEQRGGIGRYVRELVFALARQDLGAQYRLFVAGAMAFESVFPSNFLVFTTRVTPRWFARIWHRASFPLPVECFVGTVDLFHAMDFVLPPTLPRVRTMVTVHDLSFVRVPDAASPDLKSYLDYVVPRSVRRADWVLADSLATKSDLVDLYDLSSAKVSVLYSGVDGYFRPVNESEILTTRIRLGLGSSPYIFSVGTVQPRKNYERLIQSLALLRAEGYDIDLVVAGGKGWLDDSIYETIRKTDLKHHIHFIGFVDDSDLPALYSGASCFALPSLYEGFGLPLLEAMACGVPVVTSNLSSLPEVAGDAALTVNPYDVEAITHAIKRVLNDSELRSDLIKKGFERASQFSWDESARQLRSIYSDLLT